MCVVSNVGDYYQRTDPGGRHPWTQPLQPLPRPTPPPDITSVIVRPTPTREEFDKLKAEIEELKKLLFAAKEFDEKTGQPDCHADEKVDLIKRLAELVDVDLSEIFGK